MLWDWEEIQGGDVFKISSPVKVYTTSSETGTKNLKAVTVSSDKHRKVNQKDNYQSHTKHQGKSCKWQQLQGNTFWRPCTVCENCLMSTGIRSLDVVEEKTAFSQINYSPWVIHLTELKTNNCLLKAA